VGATGDLDAASAFLRACALGSPPAYYSLGLRFANGTGVPRDVAFGRALLRRAADGGFVGAAEAAAALAQEGAGDQAWYDALKTNLHAVHPLVARLGNRHPGESADAGPAVRQLEAHLVSLGHPSLRLDEQGRARVVTDRPAARSIEAHAWTWLSQQPRVAVCPRFASPEECAYLINKFAAALRPASEYRRGNSANEDAELQSFSGRGFPASALDTDSVTRMLERRLSAMAQWPIERFEPCSFVSYLPGEEYKPHVDFFSDEQIAANERFRRDYGGQRIATFLLYLRAPEEGGETRYLNAGVNVVGETGHERAPLQRDHRRRTGSRLAPQRHAHRAGREVVVAVDAAPAVPLRTVRTRELTRANGRGQTPAYRCVVVTVIDFTQFLPAAFARNSSMSATRMRSAPPCMPGRQTATPKLAVTRWMPLGAGHGSAKIS
jgi:hypothetical protein